MGDINTSKKNTLSALGYTGSIDDAYFKYLLDITGSVIPNDINDLEKKFFKQLGYSGTVGDMYRAFMNDQGLTGTLQDQLYKLWNTGIGLDDSVFTAPLIKSLIPTRGTGNPSFTRATTKTFLDHEGVLRTAKIGEAVFVRQRRVENLLSATEDFSSGAWVKNNSTLQSGFAAPDGSLTAWKWSESAAASVQHDLQQSTALIQGATYRLQFKVKAAGRSIIAVRENLELGSFAYFDLGAVTASGSFSPTITDAGNGFYLCSLIRTYGGATTSATLFTAKLVSSGTTVSYTGDGTSGVYIWHPQLENVTGQSVQTPAEYVSVGVLSAPYHGAGVDGVRYFDTKLDGTAISTSQPRGYWPEPAATNMIRNNTMAGAAAGSPGTLPTNWTGGVSPTGVAPTLSLPASTFTSLRIAASGTAGATSNPVLLFDGTTVIAATPGQVWTASVDFALTAGSFSGASSFDLALREYDSGGVFLRQTLTSLTGATSTLTRYAATATLGASTAFVLAGIRAGYTNGNVVNFTVDIRLPQLETGSVATSYIPTTSATVTRNADVLTYQTTGNLSAAQGTIYCEYTPQESGATFRPLVTASKAGFAPQFELASGVGSRFTIADDSAVQQADIQIGTRTQGVVGKYAAKWAPNSVNGYFNGVAGTLDTAANTTITLDSVIHIGSRMPDSSIANGPINNVKIWTRQLSDAYITRITT